MMARQAFDAVQISVKIKIDTGEKISRALHYLTTKATVLTAKVPVCYTSQWMIDLIIFLIQNNKMIFK